MAGVTGSSTVYPIRMNRYQASFSEVEFSWPAAQHPQLDILRYSASLHLYPNGSVLWQTAHIQSDLGVTETILPEAGLRIHLFSTVLSGLTLIPNSTYILSICAVDEKLERVCTNALFTVDMTPPSIGFIYTDTHASAGFEPPPALRRHTVMFTKNPSLIELQWRGFEDEESPIVNYEVGYRRAYGPRACQSDPSSLGATLLDASIKTGIVLDESVLNVPLDQNDVVFVHVCGTNAASLRSCSPSVAILLQTELPVAGDVHSGMSTTVTVSKYVILFAMIGASWLDDITWQSSTNDVSTSFLIARVAAGAGCKPTTYDFLEASQRGSLPWNEVVGVYPQVAPTWAGCHF